MKRVKINLSTIDKVKKFTEAALTLPCDIEIRSGKYIIDGKSIMGIFSLNLDHDIDLVINSDDDAVIAKALDKFSNFIV